jgi:hypothetical protein
LVWSDCVPPSTAASACTGDAHDVVERLLRLQRHASVWVWKRSRQLASLASNRSRMSRAYMRRAARNFATFLEQVAVRGEEERQPRREVVDGETGVACPRDVFHRVREGERELLHRRRSGLAMW